MRSRPFFVACCKIFVYFFLTSALTSCVPRVHYTATGVKIIAEDRFHTVGQQKMENAFIIFADTAKRARESAITDLHCNRQVCYITEVGVIFIVEYPAKKPKKENGK